MSSILFLLFIFIACLFVIFLLVFMLLPHLCRFVVCVCVNLITYFVIDMKVPCPDFRFQETVIFVPKYDQELLSSAFHHR